MYTFKLRVRSALKDLGNNTQDPSLPVCVCVCVCVHACVCVCASMCVCTHTPLVPCHPLFHTHTHARTHARTHTCYKSQAKYYKVQWLHM